MFVALTLVEMFAVIAEVCPRKLRTGDPVGLGKTGFGNELASVAIVIWVFPKRKTERAVRRDSGPWDARRFFLFEHLPLCRIDCIDSPQIARTHPQFAAAPCQRLRRGRR